MEYRDYKTNQSISREQYIANGLERGELLVKEDCGCVVIQDRTAGAYIVYCHKHATAPELFEALKALVEQEDWYQEDIPPESPVGKAYKALAKAEGK